MTTTQPDSIAKVNALRTGDRFTLCGRSLTISRESGWTFGKDKHGEYASVPVWNESGHETRVTVRPSSKITTHKENQS